MVYKIILFIKTVYLVNSIKLQNHLHKIVKNKTLRKSNPDEKLKKFSSFKKYNNLYFIVAFELLISYFAMEIH